MLDYIAQASSTLVSDLLTNFGLHSLDSIGDMSHLMVQAEGEVTIGTVFVHIITI